MIVTIIQCRKCLRTKLKEGDVCECDGGPAIDWDAISREHWRRVWQKQREKVEEAVFRAMTGGREMKDLREVLTEVFQEITDWVQDSADRHSAALLALSHLLEEKGVMTADEINDRMNLIHAEIVKTRPPRKPQPQPKLDYSAMAKMFEEAGR